MMDDTFTSIKQGLNEALAFTQGNQTLAKITTVHVPDHIDVREIREQSGLTQQSFADHFGFAVSTVRDWEQGRRRPEKAARILLMIIEKEPEAVKRALAYAP